MQMDLDRLEWFSYPLNNSLFANETSIISKWVCRFATRMAVFAVENLSETVFELKQYEFKTHLLLRSEPTAITRIVIPMITTTFYMHKCMRWCGPISQKITNVHADSFNRLIWSHLSYYSKPNLLLMKFMVEPFWMSWSSYYWKIKTDVLFLRAQ